jgi:membrane fusion protein (multidrug efflux system)
MFVRAVLAQAIDASALLVPQQAVSRDTRGAALALVVGADDKVEQRELTVEPAGNQWRVLTGLKAGERVIIQGQLKAKPGKVVRPVIVELGAAAP